MMAPASGVRCSGALRLAPARSLSRAARAAQPRARRAAPATCAAQRPPAPGSDESGRNGGNEGDDQASRPPSVVGALAAAMLLVRPAC